MDIIPSPLLFPTLSLAHTHTLPNPIPTASPKKEPEKQHHKPAQPSQPAPVHTKMSMPKLNIRVSPPPPLPQLLRCDPSNIPYCNGTCKSGACAPRRHHQGNCPGLLSSTNRARAAQVLETGAPLFQHYAPLRVCLEQLAPLVLCERDQGQVQDLLRIWWKRRDW
ncbi:hypothetical protein P170DRAFT_182776 [Aspergillus steynii IBT 23096]|uniref:Uncharacterized protein n=1 Tax=Aspergillus steynii IBT 23096 TaxID=1392250 RepID=A0A2I2G939_9EURO|nr:uncharacterized protein P170DRAFT_182776 [Aspergillus steynii IBT 23096]PLB49368.1 hypothetical protein P170DRAFT_182776 [Aspergillus steynii IBT 23096]